MIYFELEESLENLQRPSQQLPGDRAPVDMSAKMNEVRGGSGEGPNLGTPERRPKSSPGCTAGLYLLKILIARKSCCDSHGPSSDESRILRQVIS